MVTKNKIISEIERTAKLNGGAPLGIARFEKETGISRADWEGKLWARWGDALSEAGYAPNPLQGKLDEDVPLDALVALAREVGRFPVTREVKMKARSAPGFPWDSTFRRFGGKRELASRLRSFAEAHGHMDVADMCDQVLARIGRPKVTSIEGTTEFREPEDGSVYLLKLSRYYKIGRSNAVGRRERELAIQLPEKSRVIHTIRTDDPVGIERYWHLRFADKRRNGEWFELRAEDVRAFRRRKFM
ncbi:MAG: GIY-YIG nuclease family protein [Candidatus Zixiibacteriota bacterium]